MADADAVISQTARDGAARSRIVIFILLWLVPSFYYLVLLTDGRFDLFRHVVLGMVFNDMLAHLLHGQFDVSPEIIGVEAFVHDGRTYSYFGIFCALLRLPLWTMSHLHDVDMTIASTFVAASLSWLFRLSAIRLVLSQASATAISVPLAFCLVLAFALQGEGIQFLRASVYQEVVLWASALASLFVFLVLRGVIRHRPSYFPMSPLVAGVAGLALFTRVSTGLGLYVATGLMLVVDIVRSGNTVAAIHAGTSRTNDWLRGAVSAICSQQFLTVSAVLAFFIVGVGIVNYGRWGNPLIFADLHAYKFYLKESPDNIAVIDNYGEFNFVRFALGAQYYFLPLWLVPEPDGKHLFEASSHELTFGAGLPPGTFLLSDPVVLILAVAFACLAIKPKRRPEMDIPYSVAAITGLSAPGILMLIAIVMIYRYRLEFYPPLNLAAFLGLALILQNGILKRLAWWKPLLVAAAVLGIVYAHLSLVLYKVSPGGSLAELNLSNGWLGLFARQLMIYYPSFGRLVAGWIH